MHNFEKRHSFTQVIVNLNLLKAVTGFSGSGKKCVFKVKFSFELCIKMELNTGYNSGGCFILEGSEFSRVPSAQ